MVVEGMIVYNLFTTGHCVRKSRGINIVNRKTRCDRSVAAGNSSRLLSAAKASLAHQTDAMTKGEIKLEQPFTVLLIGEWIPGWQAAAKQMFGASTCIKGNSLCAESICCSKTGDHSNFMHI
jgi:hypothetical protein